MFADYIAVLWDEFAASTLRYWAPHNLKTRNKATYNALVLSILIFQVAHEFLQGVSNLWNRL